MHESKEYPVIDKPLKEKCYGVWTEDKLLMMNYCPIFENKYNKIELVPVQADEKAVYKALQDYLINKVEKRGIYIEENELAYIYYAMEAQG